VKKDNLITDQLKTGTEHEKIQPENFNSKIDNFILGSLLIGRIKRLSVLFVDDLKVSSKSKCFGNADKFEQNLK
jgi:hypothetical protein